MLVLERKESETIVINNNGVEIRVTLQKARDGRAKLQFAAPDSVIIAREEVYEPPTAIV